MENYNQVVEVVESLGWTINEVEENRFELSKFSPSGQDFNFLIEGEDIQELVDNSYERYDNFDVSSETYLWLDDDGHGQNGAPYDMKDLYEDMEACKEMILEVHDALSTLND